MTAPRPGIRRGTKRPGKLGDVEGQRAREGSARPRTAAVNRAGAGRASEGMTREPRPAPEAGAEASRATTGVSSPSPWAPKPAQGGLQPSPPGAGCQPRCLARVGKRCGRRERPTHAVPGVPCVGLRDTARRAAASVSSRAPALGPSGADRPATVPREALRFHSRGQRRWEPVKTCFPAVMNFITLFLSTRKASSFERFFFFFFCREKGSLAAFLRGGGGELGQSAARSEDARASGGGPEWSSSGGSLPGLGWAAPGLPWIRTCKARAGGVRSSFCVASSQARSAGREAHGPVAARDLGWVHSGLWGGAFIFWGDG